MRTILVGAAVLTLCTSLTPTPASQLDAPLAQLELTACRRVEGAELGALPLEVRVGGATVRFAEWTMADEAATDFVGFAAQLPEDVTFTVEAGGEHFTGRSHRWLHPHGVSGRSVHGIDAITFCAPSRPEAVALAR